MKILKYLLAVLFFFCLFSETVQAFPNTLLGHEITYTEYDKFSSTSNESEWLNLLYLKENDMLSIHSKGSALSEENQIFEMFPDLVDAWKVMNDAALDQVLGSNLDTIFLIKHFDLYLNLNFF